MYSFDEEKEKEILHTHTHTHTHTYTHKHTNTRLLKPQEWAYYARPTVRTVVGMYVLTNNSAHKGQVKGIDEQGVEGWVNQEAMKEE